ncbi:AraC family transcriptional regulator [Collimonas sp.]|jgi:AraC-like DNA-binding protein|uniref:AraC family transcriptional regulator n=1 Tax=Collimonas sp. TaxID=1963772 RepID=UPI002CD065A5|nr:AraC family transcriptional regulator [Collimonas sp.]HWX01518.1 AraC family transcriptional regulator [Collimonas sp.]
MDPLSDVLSLLKLHSYGCGGFDIGRDLCLQFPEPKGIKCYAVVSGQSWLAVDGVADPVQLQAGDCFLLPRGRSFCLASDLSLPPVDALALRAAKNGSIDSFSADAVCFIVGGHFALAGNHAGILLGALPPIVHLQKESDKAALRWSIERMTKELREPQPGSQLIVEHIGHMMLVQALRLHLAEGLNGGVGWLFALADQQMGAAISAMHQEPGYRWTLQELAQRIGMSRSTFAQKFKETVGKSPMEYLTRWRMLVAGDKLVHSGDPVAVIALALGYESEAAFSTAFKRVMGCSPRQYGRGQAAVFASHGAEESPRLALASESRSASGL